MAVEHAAALGGTERSVALASASLRTAGHHVHLLQAAEDVPDGFDGQLCIPELFDMAPYWESRQVRRGVHLLLDYLHEQEIDVLHVHARFRFAVARRVQRAVPYVTTVHVVLCPNGARYFWGERRSCERRIGVGCLTTGYRSKGCGHLGNGQPLTVLAFVRAMALDRRTRAQVARSDLVVAPSEWMASYLSGNGVRAVDVRVVEPPTAPVGPLAELPSPPVLLFVGRLVDFKAADHLIRASALLPFEHRILIVGDGPARAAWERLVQECGLDDQVEFSGALAPEAVDVVRRASSVVIVPSLSPETYGMVGAEALAQGVPVVAYRSGGAEQWSRLAGPLARLVEPGDVVGLAAAITGMVAAPPTSAQRHAVADTFRTTRNAVRHADKLMVVYAEAQRRHEQQRRSWSAAPLRSRTHVSGSGARGQPGGPP